MVGVVREMDNLKVEKFGWTRTLAHVRMHHVLYITYTYSVMCVVLCGRGRIKKIVMRGSSSSPKLRNVWRTRCKNASVLFRVSATKPRGDFGAQYGPVEMSLIIRSFHYYHCLISLLFFSSVQHVNLFHLHFDIIFFFYQNLRREPSRTEECTNPRLPCADPHRNVDRPSDRTDRRSSHRRVLHQLMPFATPHLNAYTKSPAIKPKGKNTQKKIQNCCTKYIITIIILFYLHFKWLRIHGLPRQTLYHVEKEAQ